MTAHETHPRRRPRYHFDSPLSGLSAHEDAPVELSRTATRTAFSARIDRAIEEKVAFIIFARRHLRHQLEDYNTGHCFNREMARLNAAGLAHANENKAHQLGDSRLTS